MIGQFGKADPRLRGVFWRGVAAGVAVSFLALVALAALFPPIVYQAPDWADGADATPAAPPGPGTPPLTSGAVRLDGLGAGPALPAATPPPGPLLTGGAGAALEPAPDVFEGQAAGSPSLFPGSAAAPALPSLPAPPEEAGGAAPPEAPARGGPAPG